MDLNELAKQPETVLALMEGELLFQFEQESKDHQIHHAKEEVDDEVQKPLDSMGTEVQGKKEEKAPVELKEPQPIYLVILVFLKDGGTVPNEQREFLRKMIRATEIPGSQMKYHEFHQMEEIESWKMEWIPQRWLSFGLNEQSMPQYNQEGKWGRGIESPAIETLWNDVPNKTILWKLMQEYFELKKK